MSAIIEFWKSTKSALAPGVHKSSEKKSLSEKLGLKRGSENASTRLGRVGTKAPESISRKGSNERSSVSSQFFSNSSQRRALSPLSKSVDSCTSISTSCARRSLASRAVSSPEEYGNESVNEFIDISDFSVQGTAGEGSFGTVYKATWKENGKVVALKALKPREDFLAVVPENELRSVYKNIYDAFKREIRLLEQAGQHPNIVSIYGKSKDYKLCALEIACCDLFQLVRAARKTLPLSIAHTVAAGVLSGVSHLHQIGIIHQDIKSSNILLDENGQAKLCDFGLAIATRGEVKVDREIITLWYRAPELLMGCSSYDARVDDWAVGCILLEMIVGGVAFPGDPAEACSCESRRHLNFNRDQLGRIFKVVGTPTVDPKTYNCQGHFGRWPHFNPCLNKLIVENCKERGAAPPQGRDGPAALRPTDKTSVPAWTTVISDLLQIHPDSRTTCTEVLEYPLFRQPQRFSPRRASSKGTTFPAAVRPPSSGSPDSSPVVTNHASGCSRSKRESLSGSISSPQPTITSAEQLLRHLSSQEERVGPSGRLPSLPNIVGITEDPERTTARGLESKLITGLEDRMHHGI